MHGDMTWLYLALLLTGPVGLLAVFAALTLADIWTTYRFLKLGVAEANPWLAGLMGRSGFDELYFAKWVVFLGVFAAAGQGWIGGIELSVACVLQAGVVVWNIYQIGKRL